MRKQIAPYIMPIRAGIAVVIAIIGLVLIAALIAVIGLVVIAVRTLSHDVWDYVWERM